MTHRAQAKVKARSDTTRANAATTKTSRFVLGFPVAELVRVR